ncbi:tRNA (N(6)-L-threonylcarbamoyladenosine(37)-C(2))-methylthiotransferase [Candidatus Woesearchaeota archaeon]|nr:tRNA (N(6)-L-threonylcarbamoyladenosine(37)-C(2))-methylthiotransferase [Candidatus Woesearchaeota archaeon]
MKIYIQTHGCSNNFYESEIMMGILTKNDLEIVNSPEDSDIIIINICTVKGIETTLKTIRNLKGEYPDKKLIIAGCISKDIIEEIRKIDENTPLVNTHNIMSIVEVIEELTQGNVLEALARSKEDKINLPKINFNRIIGIVPIASGCVDYCTYCSVKLIKGHIYSYPKEKIIEEVKNNLKDGCREIWITSQDNGAYGLDNGEYKLIQLIKEILKLKGDFKIRLGVLNPRHALKMIDSLIEIYQYDKMFKFIHIPVESGNNEILTLMKRKYNIFEFRDMVDKLRSKVEGITLATDMIVGFPNETEIQFHDSLQLIQDIKPDFLNISRFHARPNTRAFKMEQIDDKRIKNRSMEITQLFMNIAEKENKKWIGWVGEILIESQGKYGTFIGRTFNYKQVVLRGNLELGNKVKVKIKEATAHYLKGDVLEKL